jgi:Protein ChrB, N-terminal
MALTRPTRFMLLVYRMPAQPTANRVYVWRMLKKLGAVYLQQSAAAFPQDRQIRRELEPVLIRISDSGGDYHLLPVRQLPGSELEKLTARFVDQTTRHYAEIIENCEVNFAKEIEFETFRRNFTYEEAEEIRSEYEKIVDWFARVERRDWFGAPNHDETLGWLHRSRELLDEFEGRVFRRQRGEVLEQSPSRLISGPAHRSGRVRRTSSRSMGRSRTEPAPGPTESRPGGPKQIEKRPDQNSISESGGRTRELDGAVPDRNSGAG